MKNTKKKPASSRDYVTISEKPARITFLDHIQELKGRLFWICIYFLVFSGIAYTYFTHVTTFLLAPLGGHEQLYYLTPSGGLSFIIKVCMYVGVIATLPVIIYHTYRFIAPVMKHARYRAVIAYTLASVILAAIGLTFAYMVSLPAALHFLTNITVDNISAMLTIDSYLSFVIAYLLSGAALFQLPLLLLIVDGVTPLPPSKLMGFQRHMIIASFVFAAIVSPTPDVINQTILALPVVVMYQLGIILIAWKHAARRRSAKLSAPSSRQTHHTPRSVVPKVGKFAVQSYSLAPQQESLNQATVRAYPTRSIDGVVRAAQLDRTTLAVPARLANSMAQPRRTTRSIDGIL